LLIEQAGKALGKEAGIVVTGHDHGDARLEMARKPQEIAGIALESIRAADQINSCLGRLFAAGRRAGEGKEGRRKTARILVRQLGQGRVARQACKPGAARSAKHRRSAGKSFQRGGGVRVFPRAECKSRGPLQEEGDVMAETEQVDAPGQPAAGGEDRLAGRLHLPA